MADMHLDTRGLACPLPVLKTKKAMRSLTQGQTLEVLATDPGSVQDFDAFSKATGHNLIVSETIEDGTFRFVLAHAGA